MPRLLTSIWTAAAIAAVVLTGIVPNPTMAGETTSKTHIVQIHGFQFSPSKLVVAPGDTVIWINDDLVPHTVTADGQSWDSDRLDSGARWEVVVHDGMSEAYFCLYHSSMKARLRITRR